MRVRQHVNPLKLLFQQPVAARVELPAAREVEVELGCADAQFLFERAVQDPAGRYAVGLEIREELVHLVNRRADAQRLPVRAVFANANIDFSRLFGPQSIARVFVNFPDPWFKRRQHKRRVMDDELVHAIATTLRPGGSLYFQSDVFELALEAMSAVETSGRLENRAGEWSFWKQASVFGARSRREERCAAAGQPIWRLLYDRR